MKISFEIDKTNGFTMYSAISQLVKYKGKMRDELLWATIKAPELENDTFVVEWEDEWNNHLSPRNFLTIEQAKEYVLNNYSTHEPVIMGPSWDE